MIVKGTDLNTGREVEIEIEDPQDDFFTVMENFRVDDDAVRKMIDRLDISADAKSLLYRLSQATLRVGRQIIHIGRKILDSACHIIREYPNTTFGLAFGGLVGILISSIPILGLVLGPIVTPVAMALGGMVGRWEDFQDKMLARKVARAVQDFEPLAG